MARGIAASWLVAFHLHFHLSALPPGPLRTFLLSGNLAVDFFFVFSGFVIQLSWGGRLAAGAGYRELGAAWFLLRAPVVPLARGALILGHAVGAPRLLSVAPLVWLGRISYATYLPHYFLLMLFKFAFVGEA